MLRISSSLLCILLLVSQLGYSQSCAEQPSGAVAWWPLDEATGTSVEDVIGWNPGVMVNDPVPSTGKVGGVLRFDGSDDYVGIGDNDLWAFGENDFTIELWANFDASGSGTLEHPGDVFISHNEGPRTQNKWFFALGGGVLSFHINGPEVGSVFLVRAPFSPTIGQWYHLAVTRNEETYTIYIDGESVGTTEDSRPIPNPDAPLLIGQSNEPFGGFMNGLLDEVTIYNRALSLEELQAIVGAGSAGKCGSLRIKTQAIAAAQVGQPFSQQLEAVFGVPPYAWSLVSGTPPSGMSLSTSGVLSGIPTNLGSFSFTTQVTDVNNDRSEKAFTLDVSFLPPPSDVQVNKSGTVVVPGRVVDYFILLENVGSGNAEDVEVFEILNPPSFFELESVNPDPIIVDSSLVYWQLPILEPGQSKILRYSVNLNPEIPLGTVINGQACSITGGKAGTLVSKQISMLGDVLKENGPLLCYQTLFDPLIATSCSIASDVCSQCNESYIKFFPPVYNACMKECANRLTRCVTELEACLATTGKRSANKRASSKSSLQLGVCPEGCSCDDRSATGPVDPNEKLAIAKKYIQPNQLLVYPIHFENIGEVEAQDVFITDELSPYLDISTLEILTPEGASFDPSSRTLKWELLNRNLEPGETDNVLLSVKPLPDLPSGTEIRNDADIQFEIFETITTEEVVNIIDSTPPSCVMTSLDKITKSLEFPISWTGMDAVGEIESYSVYVTTDGGDFVPFLENVTQVDTTYIGDQGKTYGFFCVAEDMAGNIEIQDIAAETSTVVDTTSTEVPTVFRLLPNYPNPFSSITNIEFDIAELVDVELVIYDVSGRKVAILVNEMLEPDSYSIEWDGKRTGLASGVYYYHLRAGDFVDSGMMTLLK